MRWRSPRSPIHSQLILVYTTPPSTTKFLRRSSLPTIWRCLLRPDFLGTWMPAWPNSLIASGSFHPPRQPPRYSSICDSFARSASPRSATSLSSSPSSAVSVSSCAIYRASAGASMNRRAAATLRLRLRAAGRTSRTENTPRLRRVRRQNLRSCIPPLRLDTFRTPDSARRKRDGRDSCVRACEP